MDKYRDQATQATQDEPVQTEPRPAAPAPAKKIQTLTEHFSIMDRDNLQHHSAQPPDSSSTAQSVKDKLSAYLGSQVQQDVSPVCFWQVCTSIINSLVLMFYLQVSWSAYPTLIQIAMDYLPIQASSVPCECVFSSSAETMTKHQNCISLVLMEALQMTNLFLKKDRLKFMEGLVTSQHEMQLDEDEDDVLAWIVDTNLNKEEVMQVVDDIIIMIAEDEGDIFDA